MDCNKNQISAQLKCTVVANNFNLLFIFLKNVVWEDYKTKNNACLGMALVNKHMKIVSSWTCLAEMVGEIIRHIAIRDRVLG